MKFRTKDELLAAIEREHATFVELVESLPAARRTEAGAWGDGWTVKDLLAHLTEWERMLLGWYRQGRDGGSPALPAPGYKWNETPRLNADIQRRYETASWRRVRADFDRSYEEILKLAQELDERELFEPGRHPWTGKLPLMTYVAANTSSHYRTASRILRRFRRRLAD